MGGVNTRPALTAEEQETLLSLAETGASYRAIAATIGCDYRTVSMYALRAGIQRGTTRKPQPRRPKPTITIPDRPRDGWRDQAACLGEDPERWFPDDSDAQAQIQAATICQSCPVRGDCLADALDTRERYGIRGGLTPAGRQALRRRRAGAVAS